MKTYEVVFGRRFEPSLKLLSRRFPHIGDDVNAAIDGLLARPDSGKVIPGAGGLRKLRIGSSDLTRGKSGGYRLLYRVVEQPKPRLLLVILYSKTDREDIPIPELRQLAGETDDDLVGAV